MAALGFIGLGMMGTTISKRLLAAGQQVYGYNRTSSRTEALIPYGLIACDSIKDVLSKANIVFVSLLDNDASREVFYGPGGILEHIHENTIIVDTSTISPDQSKSTAEDVRSKGGDMVDCPISGNPVNIANGMASTMVGGRRETFDRIYSTLLLIGRKASYVGENGKGLAMKISVNLNLAIQIQGFAEAVLLAEKSGIPRKVAVEVLTGSAIASPNITSRGPRILAMPEGSQDRFPTFMMQKDVNLALSMARDVNVPLPATSLCNDLLTETRTNGWADEDFAALFFTLRAMAGCPIEELPRTNSTSISSNEK